jgi:hypothetical protein
MFTLAVNQFFAGNTIGFALGRGSASGNLNLFAITARSLNTFDVNGVFSGTMVGFNQTVMVNVPVIAGTATTTTFSVDANITNFGVRFVNVIAESQLPFAGGDIFLF